MTPLPALDNLRLLLLLCHRITFCLARCCCVFLSGSLADRVLSFLGLYHDYHVRGITHLSVLQVVQK